MVGLLALNEANAGSTPASAAMDCVVKLNEGANLQDFLVSLKEMGGEVVETNDPYIKVRVYATLDRVKELPGVKVAETVRFYKTCDE